MARVLQRCAYARSHLALRGVFPAPLVRLASTSGSGEDAPNPEGPASGWYSAESIDRRLRMRRRRVADANSGSRSPTKLSDEDYYMAAGAPGYTEEDLANAAERRRLPASASARWPTPTATSGASDDAADEDGEDGDGALAAYAPAPPTPLPLLRRTTFSLPLSALPGFTAAWSLRAAPAFAALPGCLSASVLMLHAGGALPEGDSTLDGVLATARTGARGGGATVRLEVSSSWTSRGAMVAAHADPSYLDAMAALAAFMMPPPQGQQAGDGAGTGPEHWALLADVRAAAAAGK